MLSIFDDVPSDFLEVAKMQINAEILMYLVMLNLQILVSLQEWFYTVFYTPQATLNFVQEKEDTMHWTNLRRNVFIWKPRSIEEIMSGNNVCSIKPIFFWQEKWVSGAMLTFQKQKKKDIVKMMQNINWLLS